MRKLLTLNFPERKNKKGELSSPPFFHLSVLRTINGTDNILEGYSIRLHNPVHRSHTEHRKLLLLWSERKPRTPDWQSRKPYIASSRLEHSDTKSNLASSNLHATNMDSDRSSIPNHNANPDEVHHRGNLGADNIHGLGRDVGRLGQDDRGADRDADQDVVPVVDRDADLVADQDVVPAVDQGADLAEGQDVVPVVVLDVDLVADEVVELGEAEDLDVNLHHHLGDRLRRRDDRRHHLGDRLQLLFVLQSPSTAAELVPLIS